MSEELSQTPSPRLRREARERGEVAKSLVLTGAASLLASAFVLSQIGPTLLSSLAILIQTLWKPSGLAGNQAETIAMIQEAVFSIAGLVAGALLTIMSITVLIHMVQTSFVFVPGQLTPNPSRLWKRRSHGIDPTFWLNGAWSLSKTSAALIVGGLVIYNHWPKLIGLSSMRLNDLASAVGGLLYQLAIAIGLTVLILGVFDYLLQYRKFEQMLKLTPEQSREERQSEEASPATRARRQGLVRARQQSQDSPLKDASALLLGYQGVTIILTGGPPPTPFIVKSHTKGVSGFRLRYQARLAQIPTIDAPDQVHRLKFLHEPKTKSLSPEDFRLISELWRSGLTLPTVTESF